MNRLGPLGQVASSERAMEGFAKLMGHICGLYTFGESSSVSEAEGYALAESALYVLGNGFGEDAGSQVVAMLSSENPIGIWTERRQALESRLPEVMVLWQEAVSAMPPIHNIALRDTLASIGSLPPKYDTFFAAHEIPCDIDYPLHKPVSEELMGLDYLETWLGRLLEEARFLTRFDVDEMVAYLKSWCPDYKGLLINLYEPIFEAWQGGKLEMRR